MLGAGGLLQLPRGEGRLGRLPRRAARGAGPVA